MDKALFDEIVMSLNEAIEITKGEKQPSRVFVRELPDVKKIRAKTGLSQQEFAHSLHISHKTLQNWEQGRTKPTGPAQTLLKILDNQPKLLQLY
ncbi:NadS family protein [Faucicola boevrei]|uniref:NadS family protein n=1 Tax=Faucicola boevrei TaxID=346665 RepID=UPI0003A1EB04|nr:NadS family protein [Moraxella boevrei]